MNNGTVPMITFLWPFKYDDVLSSILFGQKKTNIRIQIGLFFFSQMNLEIWNFWWEFDFPTQKKFGH